MDFVLNQAEAALQTSDGYTKETVVRSKAAE
jgi:hypothetical protein